MRVDHVPCGECVNESERIAVEHVLSKLRGHDRPNKRWVVPSSVRWDNQRPEFHGCKFFCL